MPVSRDYLPQNWAVFVVWLKNFVEQLNGALATKYDVPAAAMTQLAADETFVIYWVNAKNTAKNQEKQLNDFVDAVVNGNLGAPAEANPDWALVTPQPTVVPPGIKKRIREIVAGIKAQKSIYTEADGELLGIIAPGDGTDFGDITPEIVNVEPLANYGVELDFRKFGLTALRVEFRHKGGNWQLAAFLTKSPGVFNIVPQTPGEAEQIEIRAIGVENNENTGNYTPTYTVVIAP